MWANLSKHIVIPIPIDLYKCDVIFIYGDDYKKIKKRLKKTVSKEYHHLLPSLYKHHLNDTSRYSGVYLEKIPLRIIHIKPQGDFIDFLGILSHEILHCVFEILSHIGMNHTENSEEAYTYLMQYLTEQIVGSLVQLE